MTAIAHRPHRVATAVTAARTALSEVAGVPVWAMDSAETTATLDEVAALEAQAAELRARLLAHADRAELKDANGSTKTATWHAHRTRVTRPAAFRAMRLAQGLEAHDQLREALAAGRVHEDQALVILRALDDLPDGLATEEIARAEAHLIGEAATYDARALTRLGRRLVEVIDPDAADAHEARLLEREERAAQAATRLEIWDDNQGKLHGRFTIDSALTGSMFKKALWAFAAPKHRAAKGPLGERKPTPEQLGHAFVEMIQRYPVNRLPKTGGLAAAVVVTMTLETLRGELKSAHLDTGKTISPGAARRLACEAGIVPAVLGTDSEVLDLGRTARFYSRAQRIKASIDYQGRCAVEGCENPGEHLHHPVRWADGGETNRDGIPLCFGHHDTAHDRRFVMTRQPNRRFTFHRRT